MKYEKTLRGSEWRKWDLHVHTPLSIYQNYGSDSQETWEKYIKDLEQLPEDFSVIGINDYLFLDGYERLLFEQENNNRLQNRLLIPVVEFRIEKFAGIDFRGLKRINLHVIFSNELSLETIQSQFLNTLEQHYSLEKDGALWSRAITRESVSELGRKIKSSVPEQERSKYGSDLYEGFNNLNIKEDDILKSLSKDCFKDQYLIAIGKTEWGELKWTDSSIATKKSIINSADIVFTAAKSIEDFNKAKKQLVKQKVNDLLLDCSDSHTFSYKHEEKDRVGNCFTWIKADPSFDGLKQILNENDRVFVGEIPHIREKVQNNRTKYIDSLKIKPISSYDNKYGKWFQDIEIPLNQELVAIIGNKGSGKSAIADIIALCGHCKAQEDFSFLHKKKFRDGKHANNFEGTIVWQDGIEETKNLSDDNTRGEIERVKYLPQGYFERLTNEVSSTEAFQKEIENVVFAHLDADEKVGYESFKELIEDKKKQSNQEILTLSKKINEYNQDIINLEYKLHEDYKTEIRQNIQLKRKELDALIEPTLVENPADNAEVSEQSKRIMSSIKSLSSNVENIKKQIKELENQKERLVLEHRFLSSFKQEINLMLDDFHNLKEQKRGLLKDANINIDEIVDITINFGPLDRLINDKEREIRDIKIKLGQEALNETYKSLNLQMNEYLEKIKKEQEQLDTPHKEYQKFLAQKKLWEDNKKAIIGSSEKIGTLEYYEAELKYIEDSLSEDLDNLRNLRISTTKEIFSKKEMIIASYKEAKKKIDTIIGENSDLLKDYKIDINAKLCLSNSFTEHFFRNINRNVLGTFYSKEGGEVELKKIIRDIDFDKEIDVVNFLTKLDNSIHIDQREKYNGEKRFLSDQVKDPEAFYKYLYSLEFLEPNYQLMQGNKTLQQLSPGERGALLLVFYLLLDRNDIPLIIDQPEDNLDNNSVANILVPFIRRAKRKRQIIMVTHNPNLAVVSDAEQIIHVSIDKENDNIFSFKAGSIENRDINNCIVKVLEGAMPAFNKRKKKYYE